MMKRPGRVLSSLWRIIPAVIAEMSVRRYGLPVDTTARKDAWIAECHLSMSTDGGQTFKERNMMPEYERPVAS